MYKLVNGKRVALTDAEIVDYHLESISMAEKATEILKEEVRQKRNRLLLESDWTQFPDSPITDPVEQAKWREYRQALRDITKQANYPNVVYWPDKP